MPSCGVVGSGLNSPGPGVVMHFREVMLSCQGELLPLL